MKSTMSVATILVWNQNQRNQNCDIYGFTITGASQAGPNKKKCQIYPQKMSSKLTEHMVLK